MKWIVVREDKAPRDWWDGYYTIEPLTYAVARYWSETLHVPCYVVRTTSGTLPEQGYRGGGS